MTKFDLHFHSTYSDGKLPVSTLASLIQEQGLTYCALTDHDSVAGVCELQKYLSETESTLIPATELTARYGDSEIHLLAYGFEIKAMEAVLQERNSIVKNKKIAEMKEALLLFKNMGIVVDDTLVPEEKKPVGYTLAVAVCASEKNQDLFVKRHGRKLKRDDIYFEYTAPGKPCAVERSGVTVQWLLGKLKSVAQDIIIAHPFVAPSVVMKPLDYKSITELLDLGISGCEVYHDDTSAAQIQWLEQLVRSKNLKYVGGSDFHGVQGDLPLGHYGPDTLVPSFRLTEFACESYESG